MRSKSVKIGGRNNQVIQADQYEKWMLDEITTEIGEEIM